MTAREPRTRGNEPGRRNVHEQKQQAVTDSRIKGLYRLSVGERIDELERRGWLTRADAQMLRDGRHVLTAQAADKIIENVIGIFALPLAVVPNFIVNGRDYLVPLVVEEPSIVAALSDAARLARETGGFESRCDESLLAGQVHLSDVRDIDAAESVLQASRDELIRRANAVHPRLAARGGGVRDIEIDRLRIDEHRQGLRVHLLVDTCDAMGANLVNTICEAVAPWIAELCGGRTAMRILSNLTDRSIVEARVRYRLRDLATDELDGEAARDAIVLASEIALADPYRAATHNKGIMNGVDALAIATGNDWRAIEAGAHAFAAENGRYGPLTRWSIDADGDLLGLLRMPIKLGIVGGTLDANPAAAKGLSLSGAESASELATLMGAVGLAQNFAAIRALSTTGIQRGHMRLHARSVASAAGTPEPLFEHVVDRLIASGEVKDWKAKQILADIVAAQDGDDTPVAHAAGKVILLGEHAAVYGKHALAMPIVDAVSATVSRRDAGITISVPVWGEFRRLDLDGDKPEGIDAAIALILEQLGVDERAFALRIHPRLPRAMGLGSSSAIAVAIVRAFDLALELGLDDARVNEIAFLCEQSAHGTPSGIDNTISTYARPLLFRNTGSIQTRFLTLPDFVPIVIASSGHAGLTMPQVAAVRARRERCTRSYDAVFAEMDAISLAGADALERGDYAELGALMNVCHGLLNAIEVSTPELERMVTIARANGAVGAKLTGAGGGGSIVSLCPGRVVEVRDALESAGYQTMLPAKATDLER